MKNRHAIITLEISLSDTNLRTRTYWKFNNSLLKDNKYIEETKKLISKVKSQYCALVYNIEELDNIDPDTLELQINDALFFDTLAMPIFLSMPVNASPSECIIVA